MPTPRTPEPSQTFYEAVGGHETFVRLVHRFYEQVAADIDFRALYPEEDLGPAEDRLRMFLEQYWGGPTTYQERRGHPRLRMRHIPFTITTAERDTWLRYMLTSLDELGLDEAYATVMRDYFKRAADAMVNHR
ncbi:globin [Mariniluteicoccus endophyticus]